jgi:hypothetical protein
MKKTIKFTETCQALAQTLSACLKFFNEQCSLDLLGNGEPSFTPATLGKGSFLGPRHTQQFYSNIEIKRIKDILIKIFFFLQNIVVTF